MNNLKSNSTYLLLIKTIKSYRRKRKLTQKELAFAVNMDISSISRLENGNQCPSIHQAVKMANFLGFSLNELQVKRKP